MVVGSMKTQQAYSHTPKSKYSIHSNTPREVIQQKERQQQLRAHTVDYLHSSQQTGYIHAVVHTAITNNNGAPKVCHTSS